jgi:hypothetical protein
MRKRHPKAKYPSVSQRMLAEWLEKHGTEFRAKCLERGVDRVSLWRYARGDRRPDIGPMFIIADVSEGFISAEGWRLDDARAA